MRRAMGPAAASEEDNEITLTPMLDVVFIMLIFFIVTASFIKESGLDVNRPDAFARGESKRVGRYSGRQEVQQ
mgnify:CR=1 FL=1